MAEIRKTDADADLEFLEYDASSLKAVHAAGRGFLRHDLPLDIVLLNAGAIMSEAKASKDGLEWMFAINHLAHFALIMIVMPALEKAARDNGDVRVTSTTSAGFAMHPDAISLHIDDGELDVEGAGLWWKDTMPTYGRSKTCNILFSSELSQRLRVTEWGRCVRSNAVHPGTVSTGLNASVRSSWYFWAAENLVYALFSVYWPSPSEIMLTDSYSDTK